LLLREESASRIAWFERMPRERASLTPMLV
jgi:hypothetical protein